MKIYDCFTFYNENELVKLRFKELYDQVDNFVVVEANQTFTNRPKPWNFDIDNYPEYADKIIYIQVEDMPNSSNPWDNEEFQRNAIMRGLESADDDDIVIISDADEIPRPSVIDSLRESDQTIFAFRMALFNFKFNYMRKNPGQYDIWAMAGRYSIFNDIKPDAFRSLRFQFMQAPYNYKNDGCEVIEHGGWHFGYMGDNEYLKDKAQSFSHQEVNRPEFLEHIDVESSIAERKEWNRNDPAVYAIVELDDYFPQSVINNQDLYKKFILDTPESRALDILPHE